MTKDRNFDACSQAFIHAVKILFTCMK